MASGSQEQAPRIPPVMEPDEAQAAILAKCPVRPDGQIRNIFGTLAQHPMLLKRFNAFAGTFIAFGLVPARDRELLVLRVAARTGCRYEYAQHESIARDAGVQDAVILAAMTDPTGDTLGPADALLMRAADQLVGSGDIDDATWTQLAQRFEPPALLELVFTIGFYRMTGDVLNTVGVQVEEDPDLPVTWALSPPSGGR
jgi:AhpD family alkylhydroperoxidase